jgi:hypothetical protein
MHSNLTASVILLLSAQMLVRLQAQTTSASSGNVVTFHDTARSKSSAEPAPSLREVTAELSGTVIGEMPNISIQFLLTLQNNGPQEVRILDPLEKFSLQLITNTKKLIRLPRRVPKDLPLIARSKDAPEREKRDAPYPAPIQFRQITTNTRVSYQKEETVTIRPGGRVQIVFDGEPVMTEKLIEALRNETGENAKSFRVRADVGLLSAPPQPGVNGRLLTSSWMSLKIPSLR